MDFIPSLYIVEVQFIDPCQDIIWGFHSSALQVSGRYHTDQEHFPQLAHNRISPVLGGSGGSALTIPHRAVGGELLIVSGDKLFYLSWSYIAWAEINVEFRYYSPISRPNDDRDVFVSTRTPVI